jgi:hypothetical protein
LGTGGLRGEQEEEEDQRMSAAKYQR